MFFVIYFFPGIIAAAKELSLATPIVVRLQVSEIRACNCMIQIQ